MRKNLLRNTGAVNQGVKLPLLKILQHDNFLVIPHHGSKVAWLHFIGDVVDVTGQLGGTYTTCTGPGHPGLRQGSMCK